MKICLITNLYGELARGGAERIVEAEAAALAAAGHEVVVITTKPPGSAMPGTERRIAPHNLFFYTDAHRHGFLARLAWHFVDLFNRRAAEDVARILREEQPDVVHTHNLMGVSFLLPGVLRREGLHHVHTLHDVQLLHPSGLLEAGAGSGPGVFARLARRAYMAITRRLMGSPDVVVSPSRFLLEQHRAARFFAHSETRVIANPAPDALATVAPRESRARFLFVGQLEQHKGVLTLLDAWERFTAEMGDRAATSGPTLEIVGDGTLAGEVRRRCAELPGCAALGRLSGSALLAAYDRAAFVALPSEVIENAPTVIAEAFSRGVPVVASAVGGVPELVRGDADGFLVPPGDATALADALHRAAALNADAWQRMSAAALDSARERSMERHLAALVDVYQHPA